MEKKTLKEKLHNSDVAPPFVLIGLLSQFNNRHQAKADTHFKELTWKQMYFLNGLNIFDEAPTIKDMADFMGSSHQNANKLYAKLLAGGYITSIQDENDHRKQRVFLTEKGRTFLRENQIGNAKYVFEMFSDVTNEEIGTVIRVISKLLAKMDELDSPDYKSAHE